MRGIPGWSILILGAAIILAACSGRPSGVLSDSKMSDLLADLEIAQAYADSHHDFDSDSMRKVLRQSVLIKHGVSQQQLEATLTWYGRNIEKYTKLQDDVANRIRKRQTAHLDVDNSSGKASEGLWQYPKMMRSTLLSSYDGIVASMPAGDIEKGATIELSGFVVQPSYGVKLIFGVSYPDGVTSMVKMPLGLGSFAVKLQTDSARVANRIFSIIKNESGQSGNIVVDSLRLTMYPFEQSVYNRLESQIAYYPPGVKRPIVKHTEIVPSKGSNLGRPGMEMSGRAPERTEDMPHEASPYVR